MAETFEISGELKEKYVKMFAGKKYRPSNGTEGMEFCEHWCYQCKYWVYDKPTDTYGCKKWIYDKTLFHDVDEPEYPKEWRYDHEAVPCCTAFVPARSAPQKEVSSD